MKQQFKKKKTEQIIHFSSKKKIVKPKQGFTFPGW